MWISVFGALALRAAADDGAPNVLFILADDLGQGDVGAYVAAYGSYKSHAPSTPRLDALAASGLRFDSFRVASAVYVINTPNNRESSLHLAPPP